MNERGSILMTAVWAVSLFSIMTANLAMHAGQEVLMMKRELRGFKARADFMSGLNEAARMIQEDPAPHEDSKDKAWLGDWKWESQDQDPLSIHVEDEESKISLNHASAAFLSNFFKEFESKFGLKGDKKEYLQAILKLRYERRIESLEELLLLDEFEKEDFEILRSYLTVYTEEPLINPNTASPLVLKALVQSLGADHGAKQMLLGRLEEACQPECFFRNGDLNPENFAEKLKLPKTPLILQAVQELLASLTTDSQTFQIDMGLKNGAKASGIFRLGAGRPRPEIFWWHENV